MLSNLNKPITAIILIFSSLALLLLFLINWVHAAYEDEKEALHKEISYTFKDVIHSIEDSLVQKVLIGDFMVEHKNIRSTSGKLRQKKSIRMDSVSLVLTRSEEDLREEHLDSTVHMVFQTFTDSSESHLTPGLLPVLLNWTGDSINLDVDGAEHAEEVVAMITEKFDKSIVNKELPIEYELKKIAHGDPQNGITVEFYHHPMENQVYAAIFPNYLGYILSRMMSTILFACLLFTAISLSFYMIYSNWRKQQNLIKIKNDFISNATHELKTPISTVSVALEALSNFDVLKDKAKTKEYLQISQKELNRLKILVDKVLKMSIFEKGASKLIIEKLQIDDLVEEVLESMKIQFEKEKATVRKEVFGQDFSVEVDKVHLTNVIYNLLENAIKYCKKDPKIGIRLEASKDAIDIFIKDNGIGIGEENQRKVFNRFFRVPSGDTHNVKGHGLGLSYVASVINQHHGTIKLASSSEEGSTFHIRLNKSYVGA